MSVDKRLAEARRLSQMLLDAAELSKNRFAQIADEIGVPVHLARAICLLETAAPMTELASKLACDKSYITPLADQMEKLGLVDRVADVKDRRIKLLELTAKGRLVRERLGERVAQLSPVMVSLTASERANLEKMLMQILNA